METGQGQLKLPLVIYRSPPCVCGRDVVEVTHGAAAPPSLELAADNANYETVAFAKSEVRMVEDQP